MTRQSTVVEVGPISRGWGQVIGDVRPLTLDCGHVTQGNPATHWKVGNSLPCHAEHPAQPEPTATFRLTPAQAEEMEALEVDTLDALSGPRRHAFVEAFKAGSRIKSGAVTLTLTGLALEHAASDIGAFGNAADIALDNGRGALAAALLRHQRAAQQALSLTEARPASDPVDPTAEQRVAETRTGAPLMSTETLTPRINQRDHREYTTADGDLVVARLLGGAGGTWLVTAHSSDLGSQVQGTVQHNEAGFAGRDWESSIDGQQYPSLIAALREAVSIARRRADIAAFARAQGIFTPEETK